MGTPLGLKYIPYTYMEPLGKGLKILVAHTKVRRYTDRYIDGYTHAYMYVHVFIHRERYTCRYELA